MPPSCASLRAFPLLRPFSPASDNIFCVLLLVARGRHSGFEAGKKAGWVGGLNKLLSIAH